MPVYTEASDLHLLRPLQLAQHLRSALAEGSDLLNARFDENSAAVIPPNHGWSAKQIVGHLIDSALNNIQRAVRLSIDAELHFPGYQQNEWVAIQRYQSRPWPHLLALWQALNLQFAHIIEGIPQEHLPRVWFYNDERVTLGFLLEDYIAHMRHHLARLP